MKNNQIIKIKKYNKFAIKINISVSCKYFIYFKIIYYEKEQKI